MRAVVLASALPKLFSAGIDFTGLDGLSSPEPDPARRALNIRLDTKRFQDAIAAAERCPFPVIAAIHGAAYGLAIDIITACDVRYAAENARFSIKEVDVGLAADIGTLARLPKIAGNQSMVYELAFTAREFGAGEAEKMGLVSRVVPGGRVEVVQAALQLAGVIAKKSPIAVLTTKKVLQHAREHTVQENLDYVLTWNSVMLQSSDVMTALAGAKERKTPEFRDLTKPPAAKL